MRLALLFAASLVVCPAARAAAPGRIGLYPLSLPAGQEGLEAPLAQGLHEGAAALPGVKAFDLVAHSSCGAAEGACLGAAAKRAGLEAMISAQIVPAAHGYAFHLRVYSTEGALLDEAEGEVQGGPLDLAGGLEHGVCRVLGAAPCLGALQIASAADVAGARLLIDGHDVGALPLAAPLALPVGRHAVQVAAAGAGAARDGETRVRVSYGRTARLAAALRAGRPALTEGALPQAVAASPQAAFAPAPALATGQLPAPGGVREARSRAAISLFAGGAALLVAAGGAALYSRVESGALDSRYRSGALTDADVGRYGSVRRTGILAVVLAATGAGALAASGLVFALSPSGAAVQGSF